MLAKAKLQFLDFPGFAGILMLCQQEHCCTQTKKNQPKCFPPFETISSSSKSWYKAVLTFQVRTTWHSFASLADSTQNMNWTIIMGLHYNDKCSENMWPTSCRRWALSSALQSKKRDSRENNIKLQIPKIFHHFDQECIDEKWDTAAQPLPTLQLNVNLLWESSSPSCPKSLSVTSFLWWLSSPSLSLR